MQDFIVALSNHVGLFCKVKESDDLVQRLSDIFGRKDGIFTTNDGIIDGDDTISSSTIFIRFINSTSADISRLSHLRKVIVYGFYVCFEEGLEYDLCMFIVRNKLTSRIIGSNLGRIQVSREMESILAEGARARLSSAAASAAASATGAFEYMFPAVIETLSRPNISEVIQAQSRAQRAKLSRTSDSHQFESRRSTSAGVSELLRSSTDRILSAEPHEIDSYERKAAEDAYSKVSSKDCIVCAREMGVIFDVDQGVFMRVLENDSRYIDSFGFLNHPLVSIVASRSLDVDHCTA